MFGTSLPSTLIIGVIIVVGVMVVWMLRQRVARWIRHKIQPTTTTTQTNESSGVDTMAHIALYPHLYEGALAVWIIIQVLVWVFYIIPSWDVTILTYVSPAQLWAGVMTIWLLDGIKVVRVNEFGAVTLFGGKPTRTFGPGVLLSPRYLFQFYRFKSDVYEEFVPAKPDDISYVDDKEQVPEGKVRAWRFLTAAPKPEVHEPDARTSEQRINFTNMLDVQQFVAMSGFLSWRLRRERVFEFIIAAGGDPAQVRQQLLGVIQGELTKWVAKHTVAKLNINLSKVALKLKESCAVVMKRWGIEVDVVQLNPPNISHELAKAQREANDARAQAVKERTLADSKSYMLRKTSAAVIEGVGLGVKNAAKEMGLEPGAVYAGQVAKDTLGEGDTFVLGTDTFANVVGGAAATLLKGMKNHGIASQKPQETKTTPEPESKE